MIKTNIKMKKMLNDLKTKKRLQTKKQCELNTIVKYLWPDFIEVGECIFLDFGESFHDINLEWMKKVYGDYTGIEAFQNHIHIESIIPEFQSRYKDGFRFAQLLLETWEAKLRNIYPNKQFIIILSSNGKQHVIRLHTYREIERCWIDISKLDDYMDAILVKVIKGK